MLLKEIKGRERGQQGGRVKTQKFTECTEALLQNRSEVAKMFKTSLRNFINDRKSRKEMEVNERRHTADLLQTYDPANCAHALDKIREVLCHLLMGA